MAEPADDVERVEAWCPRCERVRAFAKGPLDAARMEELATSPSVQHAMGAEQVWACEACGSARQDLVEERAYPVAFANVAAVRSGEGEVPTGSEGVSVDLARRASSGPDAVLHEPATEDEHLHRDPMVDAELQATEERDPELEQELLDEVRRAEAPEETERSARRGPREP